MLASIFACASFHTPQTVEATETREAGLYQNGTLVKTWAELTGTNGAISVADGWLHVTKPTELVGELVCGSVESLTNLSKAFANCVNLASIDVKNLDTNDVVNMSFMFYNCTSLREIDASHFNTLKVENFNGMFAGTNLNVLNISSFIFSEELAEDDVMVGIIGMNDEYCHAILQRQCGELEAMYYDAEKNTIFHSGDSYAGSEEYLEEYSKEVAGKTDDEAGFLGKVYVMTELYTSILAIIDTDGENLWNVIKSMFDTKIETIYLPVTASNKNLSLPYDTIYTAKFGSTYKTLDNQILYGYEDLNMTTGTVLVAKAAEVESTGIETNIEIVAIAIVSIASLAFVATKKKRARNYH